MTATLFPLDQAENDRLLIDQERRKRDLIDLAVARFAPHLAGKADVTVIHLHSTNATLRRYVRDTFRSSQTVIVEHCGSGKERKGVNEVQYEGLLPLPDKADMVITKAALNSKTEWLAARLNAMPVVLPEAGEYLSARLKRQQVLVIVGADQAK